MTDDTRTISFASLPMGELEQHIYSLPVDAKRITGLSSGADLAGTVTSGGAVGSGTGFTASTSGTGIYTVTFTSAFSAAPVVVATAVSNSGAARIAQIDTVSTSAVEVSIHSDAGVLQNAAFHFAVFSV